MKRLVLLILVGLTALNGFATAHTTERILDEGVRKALCSVPLELDSVVFSMIEKRLPQGRMDTGLYRNYIGCWKIKNDSLFLDSVLIGKDYNKYTPIKIDDIFAANRTPSGYFANWVSDSLRVVSGDIVNYVHADWFIRWENEETIFVENGIVKKRSAIKNRLVNHGIGDMKFKSLLDSLEIGEFSRRIVLQVRYSNFDSEGNPTSCSIKVCRGSGDAATDDRVVKEVEKLMLTVKPLPIYYIDGKYTADTYTIPICPSRKS